MDLIHVMISIGHHPDVMIYNTLIDGLCKEGKIENTIDVLDDMILKGMSLTW
jgi:pentatricopeptide repeat protein